VKTSDFYYDLPKEFIAQAPLADRSASKLMTMDLASGDLSHGIFKDIADRFEPGDLLILNDTKVVPARLFGRKPTGGKVEVLLIKKLDTNLYEAFIRGKNIKSGSKVEFKTEVEQVEMIVGKRISGIRNEVRFYKDDFNGDLEEIIYSFGVPPTPPYIKGILDDPRKYQTVFAENPGSIAAPTAGFHFTDELFEQLREKDVDIRFVTLHVGVGTFNPVRVEDIRDHEMEVEVYNIDEEVAEAVNQQVERGGRMWLVGTTTLRTLESAFIDGKLKAGSSDTGLFIYPGHEFKFPFQFFITNFHLPESTLIMLVSAITGREKILAAYAEAKKEGYRFYSFGDACLIIR
jgi:S-adenosylmethionine:tRNA ribosyltransferase-isomerase